MAVRGIAIVGAGRIGRLHAVNLARIPGLRPVVVADPAPGAAAALAAELACEAVEDWHDVVSRPDVDAVAICSPTSLHVEQVVAFAVAGKHVFCEKPLASDARGADRALEAAEAAGIVLQVGYNRRFDRSFAAVRETVAAGRVGTPLIVRVTSRDPEPPPRVYLEHSGPSVLFLDTTSHDLDLLRFVTGAEIVAVSAQGASLVSDDARELGLADTAVTTVTFDTGAFGVIDNCWRSAYGYDQRLEVHGTDGMTEARNELRDTTDVADARGFHSPPLPHFFLDRYAIAYLLELKAFAAALEGDAVPVTGQDGRAAVAAAQAAALSAAESRIVRLDELG
jgi:myo-inositol 2-dehydrogenase / D-chiro-inositol 1-dehydrogenase